VTNRFVSIMEKIGQDCLKALSEIEKYLPAAAALAIEIFPQFAAPITGIVNSTDLIQKAIVTVETKMAAAGIANGTGAQKAADVLTIVTPTVTQLLTAEGLKVDTAYIQGIVNAVVAVLNVREATTMAAPGS
jgi:hypothetical protein